MEDQRRRLCVLIPAYNEAGVIGRVVRGIQEQPLDTQVTIVVIDDGSRDGTAAEAREAGARVITLVENLGYGYALRTGYQVAHEEGFDVVVQMDGDGQHSPESIPALAAPVLNGECDLVIGSRALSDVHYPMPMARKIGQRFFAWVLYRMGGIRIQDPTSGFQVLGSRTLSMFLSVDFPGDYPDTNVLLYLKLNGVRIVEAPAVFRINERGTSMHNGILKPMYYIYSMLFSMFMVYWRHKRTRTPGA